MNATIRGSPHLYAGVHNRPALAAKGKIRKLVGKAQAAFGDVKQELRIPK